MNKINKQNRTRGTESWNRLTAVRGEVGGDCLKEGEEIRQRTYVKGPWTWTTVWGMTMKGGEGGGEGGKLGQLK